MVVINFLSKFFDYRHQFKVGDVIQGYTITKKLGEGRFGIVYLAKDSYNFFVIIKQLKREMLLKQPEKAKFETSILKELMPLNDSRFPRYVDSFDFKYQRGYILEYKEGKTLEHIIYKEKYVFSRKEIYTIALKLLDIIHTLEKNNIVHKDIRVSNVILSPNNEIYLIDFGLARYIDHKRYKKELDYWYLGDFLIHLYYTSYTDHHFIDKPWYEQLDLSSEETMLLKRLMRIDSHQNLPFSSIEEIYDSLNMLLS